MAKRTARSDTMSLSANDEPVTSVLDRIGEALDGRLVYSRSSVLDQNGNERSVTVTKGKATPEEALEAVAAAVGCRVIRKGHFHVVTPPGPAVLPMPIPASLVEEALDEMEESLDDSSEDLPF